MQRKCRDQEALQTWTKACMDEGRDESCQTTVIFFCLGKAKQRLSGWRRAHCWVLGSVLLYSSDLSSLQPNFPSGDIPQAGWYFFLRTTRWCYFILILKTNSIQYKSVKCNVELYCFIDLERSIVSSNLFCFFLSSPQAFDFLFSILKMRISASILSCK